jgi:hypothetical protein
MILDELWCLGDSQSPWPIAANNLTDIKMNIGVVERHFQDFTTLVHGCHRQPGT